MRIAPSWEFAVIVIRHPIAFDKAILAFHIDLRLRIRQVDFFSLRRLSSNRTSRSSTFSTWTPATIFLTYEPNNSP
jgi:hypothetical protein